MENNADRSPNEPTGAPQEILSATITPSQPSEPSAAMSSVRIVGRTATLMRRAIDQACAVLGMDGGILHWWDAEAGLLYPLANNDPRLPRPSPVVRPGQGVAGQAVMQRKPMFVKDYAAWGDTSSIRAAVAIPLLRDNQILGVLVAHSYTPRHVEREPERALAPLTADMVSLLIAAILRRSRTPAH